MLQESVDPPRLIMPIIPEEARGISTTTASARSGTFQAYSLPAVEGKLTIVFCVYRNEISDASGHHLIVRAIEILIEPVRISPIQPPVADQKRYIAIHRRISGLGKSAA